MDTSPFCRREWDLTIVFEWREKGLVRVITGWDMKRTEIQYYRKHKDRG